MTDAGTENAARRWQWAVLVAIVLTGTCLRLFHLTKEGLWLDEFYSLETSAGRCYADLHVPRDRVVEGVGLVSLEGAPAVWRVWTSMQDDQHPPLYFVSLRCWREAFGSSDAAVRSLSVVASVAAIWLLFDVGRFLISPGAALWACGIMAAAQVQIVYAQEARSYALLSVLVLANAAAIVRIERFGFSRARGIAVFATALSIVLTHYYGVAACAAFALYAALRFARRDRDRTLGAFACAGVAFAVMWVPFAVRQLHGFAYGYNAVWVADRTPAPRIVSLVRRLVNVPVRFFADPAIRNAGVLPMVFSVMLALPVLRVRRVRGLLFCVLWMVAWIGLPAAIDLVRGTRQLDFVRYLLGAAPAVYLAAAGLLWDRRDWLRHVVPGVLLVYCVVSLPWTYEMNKPEWRHLAQDIGRLAGDDDLILYHSPDVGDWYAAAMLLDVEHYAPALRAPAVIMTRPLSGEALARARAARTVWLAQSPTTVDVPGMVPGFHVARVYFQWGVGLLVRLEADATPPGGRGTSSSPTGRGR